MRLRNSSFVAAGIVLFCGIAACNKTIPQTVTGTLSSNEGPVSNQTVRLYASHPGCEGEFVESKTDSSGVFRFATQSIRGGLAVVTQPIALCVENSGAWVPLWATIIGGGAHSLQLTCKPRTKEDPFVEFCEIKANYEN
jgi:hypothetical protein